MPANREKTHFHQLPFFGPAVGRLARGWLKMKFATLKAYFSVLKLKC